MLIAVEGIGVRVGKLSSVSSGVWENAKDCCWVLDSDDGGAVWVGWMEVSGQWLLPSPSCAGSS